jgi:hypothetical protein
LNWWLSYHQAFVGSEGNGRNEQLPNDGAITPCGLIGWSQFNDTFRMPGFPVTSLIPSATTTPVPRHPIQLSKGQIIGQNLKGQKNSFQFRVVTAVDGAMAWQIEDTDIAWKTDRDFLFGDVESVNYNRNTTLRGGATTTKLLSESERLIVWFRVSAFPDPTYRWGTIQQDLEPGTYELQVVPSPPAPVFPPFPAHCVCLCVCVCARSRTCMYVYLCARKRACL